jgi:hypothetical protein
MNCKKKLTTRSTAALALALLSATGALAQNTNPTNTFDTSSSTTSFVQWWGGGGAGATMSWDGTLDAANDPASGSVRYEANFIGNGGEQFMTFFTIANRWQWDGGYTLDATTYTNLSFDLKVDSSSGPRTNGADFGWLEIGLVTTPDWGTTYLPGRAIPLSATAWTHFDYPLNPTLANIDRVVGFFIKMWSNGSHTNSLIFNVDNFMITKPTVPVVIPPPTVSSPVAATPGLNFIAASAGQYDRQVIRTVATNYSWIGASGPVTYSVDVAKIGDSAARAILFFHWVPGGANPTRNDSDWHEPSVLMWRIGNNADGSAYSSLHYKTNAPDSNGVGDFLYNIGNLGGPGSGNHKGTWSITFNGNTSVTMTSSDGTTLTTNLPPEVITIFQASPGMQVNIGQVQNSGPTPAGQASVITRARFTGTPSTIDSDFLLADLDTNIWTPMPNGPNGVKWLPTTPAMWLSWTLPANGFNLQSKATLGAGSWNNLTPWGFAVGGKQHVLLTAAEIPGQDAGYFRLIKRVATKLQVLLPGETAAPGTPTGKTGTPTTMVNWTPFNITVNAVDDEWNIVPGVNHTVALTSTDPFFIPVQDINLNNSTGTFQDISGSEGTWTYTVTDVTDPTKAAGTSAPITFTLQ